MKIDKAVEVSSSVDTVDGNGKTVKKLQVVARIDIPVYETLAEIQQSHTDEVIVDLFNTQYATNLKNAARKPFNSKPGKSVFRDQAMEALFEAPDFDVLRTDKPRREAWIDAKAVELEQKWESDKAQRIAAATGGESAPA